jgi:hypothetical protein
VAAWASRPQGTQQLAMRYTMAATREAGRPGPSATAQQHTAAAQPHKRGWHTQSRRLPTEARPAMAATRLVDADLQLLSNTPCWTLIPSPGQLRVMAVRRWMIKDQTHA